MKGLIIFGVFCISNIILTTLILFNYFNFMQVKRKYVNELNSVMLKKDKL